MEKKNAQNKDRKERTCLKCGKLFISNSAGNRICGGCNIDNLKLSKQQGSNGAKPILGHREYTE